MLHDHPPNIVYHWKRRLLFVPDYVTGFATNINRVILDKVGGPT